MSLSLWCRRFGYKYFTKSLADFQSTPVRHRPQKFLSKSSEDTTFLHNTFAKLYASSCHIYYRTHQFEILLGKLQSIFPTSAPSVAASKVLLLAFSRVKLYFKHY